MNIAILIGVADYFSPTLNLPGCRNDITMMNRLVDNINKYDSVLLLSDKIESSILKVKLAEFINNFKDEEIDELFFYFTGHGDFMNNDFYYILADFDTRKRFQTSLSNIELDELFKSLSPTLLVKVVDACHSGVNYIKNVSEIDKYIKETSNHFKKCYFYYSSLSSQSSFQTDDYSYFTLSFVNAVKNSTNLDVRYKDIATYISDDFIDSPEQTPFFITQADFTEIFCTKNENINSFLNTIPTAHNDIEVEMQIINEEQTLEEIIKKDAQKTISKEKLEILLMKIKQEIETTKLLESIQPLFQIELSFSSVYSSTANFDTIGNYLATKDNYFAEAIYEEQRYEDTVVPSKFDRIHNNLEPYTVKKTRKVVSGYRNAVALPFEQIVIDVNRKYPNLDSYNCTIAFILSDRKIRIYYFITNYQMKDWEKRVLNKRYQWNVAEFDVVDSDNILNFFKSVIDAINNRIVKDIESKFKLE
jgi:hypothetical protein